MKLFLNSLVCSLMTVCVAVPPGVAVALNLSATRGAARAALYVACGMALLMPPFLVTNSWLNLFGHAGRWTGWLPFDLYGFGGVAVVIAVIVWPVVALVVHAGWRNIAREHFETDAALSGWKAVAHLLVPVARPALLLSTAVVFVLAFNQFSIPAILQVKVLPAEAWIAFSGDLDVGKALLLSAPLVVLAGVSVVLLRVPGSARVSRAVSGISPNTSGCSKLSNAFEWNLVPGVLRRRDGADCTRDACAPLVGSHDASVFRRAIGGVWLTISRIGTALVLVVSLGLPMYQLVSSPRTWSELAPAFQASHAAVLNSFTTAASVAVLVTIGGFLFARFRAGVCGWVFFLVPGVFIGVLLSWLSNRPPVDWVYGTSALMWLALVIRYGAVGWSGVRGMLRRTDRELDDATALLGVSRSRHFASVLWPQIRVPALLLAYLVFLFCIWDVETGLLVVPPGGETAALKVFNLLHYGHDAQVDALCVILLGLAVVPVWVGGMVACFSKLRANRKVLALSIGCASALLAGCGKDAAVGSDHGLESRFFSDVVVIGKRGTGAGEFNKPRSVALDREDNLYVVDMTGRVQKFSEDGAFIMAWQMPETKLGRPKGMRRDSSGNIIVIEPHYARLNHFDVEGRLVRQWGRHGTNVGEFHLPRSVVETSDHRFVVSEFGMSDRLQIFDADGGCLKVIGRPGTGEGEFDRPEGLDLDSDGRIHVADSCNHRIQIFDSDGGFVRAYGKAGSDAGELSYPYDVRVDAEGNQFVCEFGNSRIQVFDRNDRPIEMIGRVGNAPGEFFNPFAMAFDSKGNLYVADSQNHRVQKLIRRRDS